MKKLLSVVLAVVMLLGCMSVPAFATTVPSWSYDEATDTITINYEIPAGAEVGANVPGPDYLSGDDVKIDSIAFGWGVQDDKAPFIYNGVHWNPLNGTFESGNRYGYVIMITYKEMTVDHSNAKVILNGKTYTNLGNGFEGEINYQPLLIADFGVLGTDGEFSGGDFAETESGNKSGTTDITAIKAAPLSYKLVIPQNVPTITAAGVTEIGAPSVEEVKNATEKTVISYTASGTQLTLENSNKTMTTSYYTDSEGNTALTDDAIEVYKNSAVIASPTTLYVGVTETDWNAAAAGTYHATVTFNFEAVEKAALPATMTIADILATAESAIPSTTTSAVVPDGAWKSGENSCFIETNDRLVFRSASEGMNTNIKIFDHGTDNEAQLTEDNYVYTNDTKTCTFVMQNGKLTAITFSRSDNTSYNGTYTAPAVTAADALTTEAKYNLKLDYNQSELHSYSITYKKTEAGFEVEKILEDDNDMTGTYSTGLSSEVSGTTIIFKFGTNIKFTLDTSTNIYNLTEKGAVYTTITSFSVKPAGATKFTEISLTKAE